MKKTIRILIPVILTLAIILCLMWYLFVYDREFTRDMLLSCARYCESQGNHTTAAWFYNCAYSQVKDNEAVAIELAEQYKASGNYTKAEFTLRNAIEDGGGIELYIALCKTYVEQDKLWDAVSMLNNITNPKIKEQLDKMRPAAPTSTPEQGMYTQYISASIVCNSGTLYVSTDGKYPSVHDVPYSKPIPLKIGENSIRAISVSESGLVSPLSVFVYAIGGVNEIVELSDSAMEAAIRNILSFNTDKDIYTGDLRNITSFSIPADAKNYSVLSHMTFLESLIIENGSADQLRYISGLTNLKELNISGTSVSQETLSAITALPNLRNLRLSNCNLTSISPLASAKGLVALDLSGNAIRNIDPISNLQEVLELNLQQNALTDLTALSSLSKLQKLNVSYNALVTIAPICSLGSLTWLDAGRNTIASLEDMSQLSSLTYLSLTNNALTSLSNISACGKLTELFIANNMLTDISSLSGMTKLMYLDFSYNQVTALPTWSAESQLVSIDGSHNQVKSISELSGLKRLNNVYMDYNAEIKSISELANCPMLVQVNVYGTKVKNVSALTDQSIIVNYDPT